jgi:serine/threonine protein kinase
MNKAGIRSTNQKPYENKQSFYSEWANGGNLSTFLTSIAARALLSQRQMDELAIQLLTAVLAMHKKGLIHQDIKSENILLFQDKGGNYRLELSDFGITYDPAQPEKNKIPLATLQFESPEISAIHYYFSKEPNFNLPYFHDRSHESYGRDVFLSNKHSYRDKITADIEKFSSPSKENDMWAIGTVLHQLYNQGELPTQTNFAHFSPLIKGLLNKNREKRFTAEQALAYLQPHLSPTFPALSEPSTSTVPLPNTALAVHGGAGQTSKPSPVANNPLLPRGSTVLTDRLPPRAPKVLLPKASKLAERLPKVPSKAAPGPSSRVPKTKNKENDEQSPEKGNKPPWR